MAYVFLILADRALRFVTGQHNIAVTLMSPILRFQCRRPVNGHSVLRFDERKFIGAQIESDFSVTPPRNATADERLLLAKWGANLLPAYGERPEETLILHPNSDETIEFDLFSTAPGLFQEFAFTQTTVAGITAFADCYGSLTNYAAPDYIDVWRAHVLAMRKAVKAWEKAKETGDFSRISRIVERRGNFLHDLKGIECGILLRKDRDGVTRLCIRPPDFLEALWVQLILAIDGNENYRRCDQCSRWFPIASAGRRPDRIYCSDACRMRAYRRRKN